MGPRRFNPQARVNVEVFWTVQASALLGPWPPSLVALCVAFHFVRMARADGARRTGCAA